MLVNTGSRLIPDERKGGGFGFTRQEAPTTGPKVSVR